VVSSGMAARQFLLDDRGACKDVASTRAPHEPSETLHSRHARVTNVTHAAFGEKACDTAGFKERPRHPSAGSALDAARPIGDQRLDALRTSRRRACDTLRFNGHFQIVPVVPRRQADDFGRTESRGCRADLERTHDASIRFSVFRGEGWRRLGCEITEDRVLTASAGIEYIGIQMVTLPNFGKPVDSMPERPPSTRAQRCVGGDVRDRR